MDDRQIVAGVRLGDRQAVAELYDRYADALHDYARRRTNSEADAADVVHDAFLVAVERIGQLRDPERLRPWLYAIARTELHRGYRHAARYAELDGHIGREDDRRELVSAEPGPDVQVERRELVALLREATAGLTDTDRELLDLHMRHNLVGAGLAAAAGMPAKHASVALDRVKGRLARTLGVVLLARQPTCPGFVAIQAGQEGMTPLVRKRLARHVDNCEICYREQARRMRPEVLLAAVPVLPAPRELRQRLLSATQARVPAPTGQVWDDDGFPWPPRQRGRRRPVVWAAASALLVLAIGGALLVGRPWETERAVALGPATPPPSATSTSKAPLPGAVVASTTEPTTEPTAEPTTTTPPPTTRRTTTRRSSTTTTTTATTPPPPDTTPPAIGPASLTSTWFSASWNGQASCTGAPITAKVQAIVTDPSGVAGVTITWSGPAGTGGSPVVTPGPGGSYSATVGPVVAPNLAGGSYALSVTVVARDGKGNETKSSTTFKDAVHHCVIG
jgi:RNA polymerase sigma factor (sigma-70 family)